MNFGVILAGGVGSRMCMADMPKQFLPLGNKPIIIHTLETFLTCTELDKIYIGVHGDWVDHMRGLLDTHVPAVKTRISVVTGGRDRNESLLNVITAIEEDFGESDDHIIVTHDAVRPFVTLSMIRENIACAKKYGAVNTVTPAVDTIFTSTDGKVISHIPDRAQLYHAQTPQSFHMSLLKTLYLSLSEEEKGSLTDACKICVVRDHPVYLVKGSYTNIKITTPEDYAIAQAMVAGHVVDQ